MMNNSMGGPGPVSGAGAGQMGQVPAQMQGQMGMNPMVMSRMPMGPDQVHKTHRASADGKSSICLELWTIICIICSVPAEVLLRSCGAVEPWTCGRARSTLKTRRTGVFQQKKKTRHTQHNKPHLGRTSVNQVTLCNPVELTHGPKIFVCGRVCVP